MKLSEKAIKFLADNRALLFTAVFVLLMAAFYGNAQAQDKSDSLLARVTQLETRLKQIESDQAAILEKQDQIIEELKVLRVWVRRN